MAPDHPGVGARPVHGLAVAHGPKTRGPLEHHRRCAEEAGRPWYEK